MAANQKLPIHLIHKRPGEGWRASQIASLTALVLWFAYFWMRFYAKHLWKNHPHSCKSQKSTQFSKISTVFQLETNNWDIYNLSDFPVITAAVINARCIPERIFPTRNSITVWFFLKTGWSPNSITTIITVVILSFLLFISCRCLIPASRCALFQRFYFILRRGRLLQECKLLTPAKLDGRVCSIVLLALRALKFKLSGRAGSGCKWYTAFSS